MVVISTIVILKNHLYALSIVVKNRLLAQQNFRNEINEKDKFLKICIPSYIFFKEDTNNDTQCAEWGYNPQNS